MISYQERVLNREQEFLSTGLFTVVHGTETSSSAFLHLRSTQSIFVRISEYNIRPLWFWGNQLIPFKVVFDMLPKEIQEDLVYHLDIMTADF